MSNTPRTDAFCKEAFAAYDGKWITLTPDSKAWDLARQLERENGELRFALRGLHDDVDEYQRINHLGGHDNHWMVAARAALKDKP